MKTMLISLLLAILLIACIVFNNIYINHVAEGLLAALDLIPPFDDPECVSRTRQLCEDWDRQVEYVRLSVGYTVVDRVCEQATTLLACAECRDLYGFQTALALLRDAIGDMRRLEVISISNIL